MLVLCDNRLTELPDSICGLPRLRTLLLHANSLSTLPSTIVRLRALKQARAGSMTYIYSPRPSTLEGGHWRFREGGIPRGEEL